MASANVYCTIDAPVAAVFARIADHGNYQQLPCVKMSRLIKQGQGDPNGLGAVRELRVSILHFIEDITAYQAPLMLEYRVRACYLCLGKDSAHLRFPLIHKLGRITLTECDGKAEICWLSEFTVGLPFGELIAKLLRPLVEHSFLRILCDMSDQMMARPRP